MTDFSDPLPWALFNTFRILSEDPIIRAVAPILHLILLSLALATCLLPRAVDGLPAWPLNPSMALVAWAVASVTGFALLSVPLLRRLDTPGAVAAMMVGLGLPPMVLAVRAARAAWPQAAAGLWLSTALAVAAVAVVRLGRRRERLLWIGQIALVASALILPLACYVVFDTTGTRLTALEALSITSCAVAAVTRPLRDSLPLLLGWSIPAVALAAWAALDRRSRQAVDFDEEVFVD